MSLEALPNIRYGGGAVTPNVCTDTMAASAKHQRPSAASTALFSFRLVSTRPTSGLVDSAEPPLQICGPRIVFADMSGGVWNFNA
ncbi:hypothetical protein BD289DRAFT_140105 [Coniella lustricola]|uniref:Uncharacterized protein n=1 Tax=Coniella lustricola TaxID=2025994 RepID=A0A2T3AF88_9PEZI|nr:hypothetical protein BD289DRAFT_140105 [Coniella lustricola]